MYFIIKVFIVTTESVNLWFDNMNYLTNLRERERKSKILL